ncbi:MAG: DUF2169 domain-containing protein [Polyangiaceae bacterium]|jgi:hypothetical protein
MDPPAVDNATEFAVHPQLLLDKDGEKLTAIVKATFEVPAPAGGPAEIAPAGRQRPVRLADIPWDDRKPASIAYPADLCLRKPGTDVILVAIAYAPLGQPVPHFDAFARVGPLRKMVRVHGLRVWQVGGAGLSGARPIAQMEMKYDHAWGGTDDSDPERLVEEPRNPIGMGVARDPAALTDRPAPHLEDPAVPIIDRTTRPPPAGMGPIGRHWEPRRRFTGTYDAVWLEHRAPLPPEDQDDRFHLCASPGLTAVPPLVGGEPVALLNLVPGGGATTFPIPAAGVEIEFRVKDREPAVFRPRLDTVVIDLLGVGPHKPISVELVWRAYVNAPRRMKESKVIVRDVGAELA